MIHQLIFAHPKPGMSEADFQTYWKTVHAPQYASKIPQIKRYMIDCRLPFGAEKKDPLWSGVAEIWFDNEEDQLASLQSPEFLEGARVDEPKWAAFWRTVVLDTDTHILREGPSPSRDLHLVKLVAPVKRKEGMPLGEFRRYSLDVHAPLDLQLPGLRRYYQCHVRDSFYTVGEALLDAVSILWFDDVEAVEEMLVSIENKVSAADLENFVSLRYAHVMLTDETWIIGPESR